MSEMSMADRAASALEALGKAAEELPPEDKVKARIQVANGFVRLAAIEKGLLPADMIVKEAADGPAPAAG